MGIIFTAILILDEVGQIGAKCVDGFIEEEAQPVTILKEMNLK